MVTISVELPVMATEVNTEVVETEVIETEVVETEVIETEVVETEETTETETDSWDGVTDVEGYYMQTLPQGVYDFVVSKSGYLPYTVEGIVVNPDETTYMETFVMGIWATNLTGNYGVQGFVKDALKGTSVENATVKLRKGWNNQTGEHHRVTWIHI